MNTTDPSIIILENPIMTMVRGNTETLCQARSLYSRERLIKKKKKEKKIPFFEFLKMSIFKAIPGISFP